jgi:hypothetical protein
MLIPSSLEKKPLGLCWPRPVSCPRSNPNRKVLVGNFEGDRICSKLGKTLLGHNTRSKFQKNQENGIHSIRDDSLRDDIFLENTIEYDKGA